MARILAFDVGTVRTGIAETDPMKIIATGVGTVETSKLLPWLSNYLQREKVETLVIGEPLRMHGVPSDVEGFIQKLMAKIRKAHSNLRIERQDERFTSSMARSAMVEGGMKASRRKKKDKLDEISAVLILQAWMEQDASTDFG